MLPRSPQMKPPPPICAIVQSSLTTLLSFPIVIDDRIVERGILLPIHQPPLES